MDGWTRLLDGLVFVLPALVLFVVSTIMLLLTLILLFQFIGTLILGSLQALLFGTTEDIPKIECTHSTSNYSKEESDS